MTKLIVGLGNPGQKYINTRHNIGFMVIDRIVNELNLHYKKEQAFQAEIASLHIKGEKYYFVKPQTFMNDSGIAIHSLLTYYGLTNEDLLVIYDDLDMTLGKIRYRKKGSAGGHNGIKSIIKLIDTNEFDRIKVGIDHPKENKTVISHVLGKFTKEEEKIIDPSIDSIVNAFTRSKNYTSFIQELIKR